MIKEVDLPFDSVESEADQGYNRYCPPTHFIHKTERQNATVKCKNLLLVDPIVLKSEESLKYLKVDRYSYCWHIGIGVNLSVLVVSNSYYVMIAESPLDSLHLSIGVDNGVELAVQHRRLGRIECSLVHSLCPKSVTACLINYRWAC